MNNCKKIICFCIILLCSLLSYTQVLKKNNDSLINNSSLFSSLVAKVCIKNIVIAGTKKTKNILVYREIQFKQGDSILINEVQKELEQARIQIYNTTLFNDVTLYYFIIDSNNISVNVQVTERWYFYPVPQFQLVGRNFNDWYKTNHANFDRVNYGLRFVHYNLRGQRDQLRIYLINGYTRNISFLYSNPYRNSSLNNGFIIGAGYFQNREIIYKTDSANKPLFYKPPNFSRNTLFANIGFTIRKGLFTKHIFTVSYMHQKIDDLIISLKYNPLYFNEPVTKINILDFNYIFQYTHVNNSSYPLTGKAVFISIQKRGLKFKSGINMLQLDASVNKYSNWGKGWYSGVRFNGKIKLPFNQAYINQQGLGYKENYLRGLEYYVIDGLATILIKSNIKKKIISFNIPFTLFPKIFTKIPFTIFAKTYADIGYVYNKKNNDAYLNNRILYSGGFGIDILTLYDINLRLEYSFNQLKENGLFLHN